MSVEHDSEDGTKTRQQVSTFPNFHLHAVFDSHSHQREDARVLPSGVTCNFSVPKQIIITTSFKGS